jgi:antitoxin component YwqK of YwqJK toxin-antitoxin module
MKTRYLIPVLLILTLPISVMGQERMDLSNLVQKGDQYLIPGILSPYTGPIVSYYSRNLIRDWGQLRNGVRDGPFELYDENGQLLMKTTYKDGERDGPSEWWRANGQLITKSTWKDGEYDGPYEGYLSNGQLMSKGTYKDGEQCGEWLELGETVTHPPCSEI